MSKDKKWSGSYAAKIAREVEQMSEEELRAVPDGANEQKHCPSCGKAIPKDAHGSRKFCDNDCRREMENLRRLKKKAGLT